jgi:type IV pilus assembly protein PilM
MALPRVFAVDCGAGHITSGLITSDKSGILTLEQLACDAINPDPASDGEWLEMIANSLSENSRSKKQSGAAVLGLPGHHILGKFIKIPTIEESKRAKIVQFEAQQNIPYPLNEVVWDYEVVSEHGLDLELMLAAVKQDLVQGACDALTSRGLKVLNVLPASVAVARCFRYNYPEVKGGVVVADIGARSTNLIFIDDGRFFVRTIPLAGNTITQSIAEELKLDFTHSEMTKVQVLTGVSELPVQSPTRAVVQNAVNSFVGKLHLEVTRSIVNYRRQSGAEQPNHLYLTGGGSVLQSLSSQLNDRLKISVEILNPLKNVRVSADASRATEVSPMLAGLIGLAAPGSGRKPINLLPITMLALLDFKKRQPYLILAAALIALSQVPPLIQSARHLAAIRSQEAALKEVIMPLQVLQDKIKSNSAQFDEAAAEISAIQSLAESKNNWINFMSDLQERLIKVQDVWLDTLEVIRPNALGSGNESGGLFGGAPADPASAGAAPGVDPTKPVIRLKLSGRLIDRKNPVSRVSPDSYERIKNLLTSFAGSQFIAKVEKESFDPNTPGILRFDFIMVIDPARPL